MYPQPQDPWEGEDTTPPSPLVPATPEPVTLPDPALPPELPGWRRRWNELSDRSKLLATGGAVALLCCCGGLALALAVPNLAESPAPRAPMNPSGTPTSSVPARPPSAGIPTSGPSPSAELEVEPRAPAPPAPARPGTTAPSSEPAEPTDRVETRTVTETVSIPHGTTTVEDPSLPVGTERVRTRGVDGEKTLTYEVTLTNGEETDRSLVGETVTREPVDEVIAIGTMEEPRCHPNYSGACVPLANDVDCEGGTGDGPEYVRGPVRIVGEDVYGLDDDDDGIGCED